MTVFAAHPTILVTDGEQRAALAAVRSLGAAGARVLVAATHAGSLAAASRFADREFVLPSPLTDPERFSGTLSDLVAGERAVLVLPITEPSLLALLPVREGIPAIIPFARAGAFSAICDKDRVLAAAARHGIRIPQQRAVVSPEGAAEVAGGLRYPIVIKPSRSVVGAPGERRKTSVAYAHDARALESRLAALPPAAFPVLLQERIEGPGTAISVLIWKGELLAAFAHRRLREKPPSGGVSVLRESIPLDHDLLARSLALLADFDWNGVAMVEFKVDATTDTPVLMEVNGRLWGSLQLAIDSGVDFPALLVRAALGERVAPVTEYPAGIRTRWEWGDVDHALAVVRHSRAALSLPEDAPGRLRTVAAVLRGWFDGSRSEVFHSSDPRPFLRESAQWFGLR